MLYVKKRLFFHLGFSSQIYFLYSIYIFHLFLILLMLICIQQPAPAELDSAVRNVAHLKINKFEVSFEIGKSSLKEIQMYFLSWRFCLNLYVTVRNTNWLWHRKVSSPIKPLRFKRNQTYFHIPSDIPNEQLLFALIYNACYLL